MRLQKLKCREKNVNFQTKSPKKYRTVSNDVTHVIGFQKKMRREKKLKTLEEFFKINNIKMQIQKAQRIQR